ncbi:MAG: hypothetical protein C7B45_05955 [Sulfobacillus acidophilus]|uniref:Uncharacterized protein n=1 Tax=Sulfobacillus acidophilus TaxID=53633 RepID=A0A2T2WK79_9FIRM|nr:MAG: hypothetical protein C7B45_05955 [Sulfobacillus acidophilus]
MDSSAAIAIYDTHELADHAVKELQRAGFDMKKLSIVGKGYHSEEHPVGYYTVGDKMRVWGGLGATWGAIWGGFWGLLFGTGFFLIPGLGPILAAGPLVAILVGALEGGVVVGGLSALGVALVNLGVPKQQVIRYEEALKADKYVLIVHGSPEEVQRAKLLIDQEQATTSDIFATS